MQIINNFFKNANEFLTLTLKFKDTITSTHMQQIKDKSNKLGLNLQKSDLDTRYINSKDFVAILKSKLFCLLCQVLLPNTIQAQPALQPQKTYKFWVECMGNNHNLVKSVIKKRRWLTWIDVNTEALWAGTGP